MKRVGVRVGFSVSSVALAWLSFACSDAATSSAENVDRDEQAVALAATTGEASVADIACVDDDGNDGVCTSDGAGHCVDDAVAAGAHEATTLSGSLHLRVADDAPPGKPACPKVECPMKDVRCGGTAPTRPPPAGRTECTGNSLPSACTYTDPQGRTHGSGSGVCAATRSCTKTKDKNGRIVWIAPTCGCFKL